MDSSAAYRPTRLVVVLDPDDSISLGNWLARNGHAKAALTIYQRHLRDYPVDKGAAEAHAYAGLLQLHAFREPTAAAKPFSSLPKTADRGREFMSLSLINQRRRS